MSNKNLRTHQLQRQLADSAEFIAKIKSGGVDAERKFKHRLAIFACVI
jgi:hypothetical protein